MDAEKPVIFHTMELDENNPNAGLPALNIFVHKLVLPQVEAHFFEVSNFFSFAFTETDSYIPSLYHHRMFK